MISDGRNSLSKSTIQCFHFDHNRYNEYEGYNPLTHLPIVTSNTNSCKKFLYKIVEVVGFSGDLVWGAKLDSLSLNSVQVCQMSDIVRVGFRLNHL